MGSATNFVIARKSKTRPAQPWAAGPGTSFSRTDHKPRRGMKRTKKARQTEFSSCAFCASSGLLLERRQRATRGFLFLQPERPVGLHQRMNVARALVNDRRCSVPQIALKR